MPVGVLKARTALGWRRVGVNAANDYKTAVLADAPAVYWRLGDASGTTAADASGYAARNGTYVGGISLGAPGLLIHDPDTAATFHQSTAERVELTYAAWMDVSRITVEALIKTTTNHTGSIWDRDDNGPRIFQFRLHGNVLEFILIGSPFVYCTGSTDVLDGRPHHVAATYDGAAIRVYVDGELDATTATTQALPTGAVNLRAGINNSSGFAQPFAGVLDELALYPTALSEARLATHARAALGGLLKLQLPDGSWLIECGPGETGRPLRIQDPANPGMWINVACMRPHNPNGGTYDTGVYDTATYD